ncbi:Ig-like domain repeat protein [Methanobrevibacter sp.]
MGCAAAHDTNSTDLTIQDSTNDEISHANELPEMEISEVSNDLENSKNDSINVSTPKNLNPDEKLAAIDNDESLSVIPRGHAFVDIYDAIELAGPGGVIDLEETTYIGSNPIEVYHSVTINGNGAILDAHGIPLIFRIHESNVTIKNITFINCRATINGGAIYWSGKNGMLVDCTFKDNEARLIDGGAVYWSGDNGNIVNCNFINNTAGLNGGAVYLKANNCNIKDCNFTNNTAKDNGGAVYLMASNCKIDNCDFTENTASGHGGAVYCSDLLIPRKNNTISNCNFTDNTAKYDGGAVYLGTDNSNIDNCFFDSNSGYDGGAVYLMASNCEIDNSGLTNNTALNRGGAVYCGEVVNPRKNNEISDCIFTDNAADEGGAVYITGENIALDLDYFNDNVAKRGSAIYINRASKFINISNTEFDRNTADCLIFYSIDDNETYALANVTVNAYLLGNDNIANAIWNNGETTSVQLYNITCEFSKDGKGRSLKKFNMDGFANPTKTFEDESKIWQNSLENAQLIDILVSDENGNIVLNITNGVSQSEDTNLIVTDTIGKISVTLPNLKAGKYSVLIKHEDDQYYTADEDSGSFVVYELKVTKTSEKLEYDVDEEVKYTIVVNNTGNSNISDVTIVENFPEEFYIDAYSLDESLGNNSLWQNDGDTFVYQQVLHPHEVVTLVLGLFTLKNGTNITNSITVSSNITDACIVESNNITVYRPSIDISKTAVNSTIYIGDQAVFIINVTNNGDRTLKAKDTIISEWFINGLIYDHISSISGEWSVENLEEGLFTLDSPLDIGESASFKIYFNTTELGEHENTIYGWYAPETVGDTVTVIQIPTHISVENVTVYPGMNVTIPINVTTDDNKAFSGNVTVKFPDGSNQTVEIIEGNGNAKWFVLENQIPGIYNDTVSYSGNYTHLASAGNGTITVESVPSTAVIENVTVKAGQNATITVNVTSDNNNPFNGDITVTLPDGSTQTVKIADGSGKAVWSVPEDYNGNYSVSADYSGNVTYLPFTASGTVTVIPKIHVEIVVSNETAYPDSDVTITINVTPEYGNPFNGKVKVIMPNGSNQTVEIVDGVVSTALKLSRADLLAAAASTMGTGTADWHVPASFAPGNYPVLVEFDGSDDYFAANGTGNIEIIPVPTEIKVSNVTGKSGQNVAIPINVISDNNKPFNGDITVTLPDGSVQNVKIADGSGKAVWSVPEDYEGTYEYTVNYPGNDSFLPSNATGFITVTADKQPVDNDTVDPDENQVNNDTVNPDEKPVDNDGVTPNKDVKSQKENIAKNETGNPILALLAVLILLGASIKRKK